jgi:hypothetical protein
MADLAKHTYEEIRNVVIDILLQRERVSYEPSQWVNLQNGVAEIFARRETPSGQQAQRYAQTHRLHSYDAELIRDVFWDLFRQGFITLGMDDSNPAWPFFRLSHFGQQSLLSQSPYRFHDTNSFI